MPPILIVDDSEEDMLLAERVLRQCKIQNPVLKFSTGEELFRYFAPKFEPPVLVLLDMLMPSMDGAALLKEAKKRRLTEDIPFVMLSGLRDLALLKEGYQNGARTFVVKPLGCQDIMEVLGNLKGIGIKAVEGGYMLTAEVALSGTRRIID